MTDSRKHTAASAERVILNLVLNHHRGVFVDARAVVGDGIICEESPPGTEKEVGEVKYRKAQIRLSGCGEHSPTAWSLHR